MNNASSTELMHALDAIRDCQKLFLEDLRTTCDGDPSFLPAFRRWEERLTQLKLHIHRAEHHLLHVMLVPAHRRQWRNLPGPTTQHNARRAFATWHAHIISYFQSLRLDTRYIRLSSVLDFDGLQRHDDIIRVADISTDIIALAELCEKTGEVLERFALLTTHSDHADDFIEDMAFFHVLSPWKQQGLRPLGDVSRWLHEFLNQHSDI